MNKDNKSPLWGYSLPFQIVHQATAAIDCEEKMNCIACQKDIGNLQEAVSVVFRHTVVGYYCQDCFKQNASIELSRKIDDMIEADRQLLAERQIAQERQREMIEKHQQAIFPNIDIAEIKKIMDDMANKKALDDLVKWKK